VTCATGDLEHEGRCIMHVHQRVCGRHHAGGRGACCQPWDTREAQAPR
jgi:hypothetical protein